MKATRIFLFIFMVVIIAACDSDNNNDYQYTLLEVEEATTTFPAKGGSGEIILGTSKKVTMTCDKSWCKATLTGNKISLTVDPNLNLLGRTALITLETSTHKDYIPITQTGIILTLDENEVEIRGKGGQITVGYSCDIPITVSANADWITWSVKDEEIVLNIAQNPSMTAARQAKITVKTDNDMHVKEINVLQEYTVLEYEDYLGEWKMSFVEGGKADEPRTTLDITLLEKTAGVSYAVEGLPVPLEMTFNSAKGQVSLLGQIAMTIENGDYVRWCPRTETSYTTSTTGGFYGEVDLSGETIQLSFVNNDVWKPSNGLPPIGFYLRWYNAANTSLRYYEGIYQLCFINMEKVD